MKEQRWQDYVTTFEIRRRPPNDAAIQLPHSPSDGGVGRIQTGCNLPMLVGQQ
jgi:hypothetical protein